jgi:hypothetical protein
MIALSGARRLKCAAHLGPLHFWSGFEPVTDHHSWNFLPRPQAVALSSSALGIDSQRDFMASAPWLMRSLLTFAPRSYWLAVGQSSWIACFIEAASCCEAPRVISILPVSGACL